MKKKKFYSYRLLLDYSFKLFGDNSSNEKQELTFRKDIISLCSSSVEEFWNDFDSKKINDFQYKHNCKKIEKYVLEKQPAPYLNKKCSFYNISLEIEKGIFIPQSDTEILVEAALNLIEKIWDVRKNLEILEIGTGSGNVAISIAKNRRNLNIIAVDINKKALYFAKKNSEKLGTKHITFMFSNVFSDVKGNFDVIISNPPYVAEHEYHNLSSYTKKQPKKALLSKNNGYWFYEKIINDSNFFLKKKFLVIFEVGCNQVNEIIKILLSRFAEVKIETFKDFDDKVRVLAFYRT